VKKTNQIDNWDKKKGKKFLEIKNAKQLTIISLLDAYHQLSDIHLASHIAPIGQNPTSSRGHVIYIINIYLKNEKLIENNEYLQFIIVDLAGTDSSQILDNKISSFDTNDNNNNNIINNHSNNSSLTSINSDENDCRRRETNCIKQDLLELQSFFL